MFLNAVLFNSDLSEWDVSKVTNMDNMFADATSFEQNLCGDAWVHSKASKDGMFKGSSGSIPQTTCTTTTTTAIPPRSKEELKNAVDACLKLSPEGDCSTGPHGPIGEWDVSSVTDMRLVFSNSNS